VKPVHLFLSLSGVRIKSLLALVFVLSLVLFVAKPAYSQNTNSGVIRGTVTDASGAVVPGANVTVKNNDTGVVREFVTNSDGLYDTNSILPGTYTVTFSKVGFQKLVKESIILPVAIITVNGELTVGTTTQEITVVSTLQQLKTEDAEQSTTLPTYQMTNLPSVGQQSGWENFLVLVPGAAGTPGQGNASNPGVDQQIDGTAPYFSSYLIDGGSIRLPASANIDEQVTEAVAELQIIAGNASAQYGGGGNVFNLISKTGTNQFHGTAYDYIQNDALNARDAFNATGAKARQRYNYIGGAVGGPIKKNKVFFYFNYDFLDNPSSGTSTLSVPTAAMKAGCFNPAVFGNALTLDAAHGGTALTTNVAQCGSFDNNNGADLAIPTADMDPVAVKIQSYYVAPNTGSASLLSNNYRYLALSTSPDRKYFVRMDFNLSDKNRVNLTLLDHINPVHNTTSPECPIQCQTSSGGGKSAQITDVYTFSPTLVNEFRFSTVRQTNFFITASLGKGLVSKIGLTYSLADEFPDIQINGTGGNGTFNEGNDTNAIFVENNFDPTDTLTMIRGKHILKFGGEVLRNQNNSTPWGNLHGGNFTFTGQYTAGEGTDVGYADFLLGDVQAWSAVNQALNGTRDWNPTLFVQDDFKVRPNLTVNLGVRWEIHGGFYNQFNQAGGFDPNLTDPATGTPGYIWFQGASGDYTKCFATVYGTVMPRLGFAWSPTDKWVVRGGLGEYSAMWSGDTAGGEIGYGSGYEGNAVSSAGQLPVITLSGAPSAFTQYNATTILQLPALAPPTRNPAFYNGSAPPYYPYNMPAMKGWQWSASVQRRLPGNMVVEAAYVGSHWGNLMFEEDVNSVPTSKLSQGAAARPFPQYANIGIGAGGARTGDYAGISNYESAQFILKKPLSYGVTLDVNFTYSQFKDDMDTSGWGNQFGAVYYQDAYNLKANYGPSNFNTPKALKGSVIYAIPLGRGHKYLSSAAGNAALGGWQASTIFVAQSGAPFTVVMNENNSGASVSNQNTWYPNLVGNPSITRGSNPGRGFWFNQLAYATPATDTFGNAPRNSITGPDLTNINFSLVKSFNIPRWEQGKLQIRMDATNIFNHPSFNAPSNSLDPAALASGVPDPGVGVITGTTVTGRVIQLSGRFSF
jgi:hypothetical protein